MQNLVLSNFLNKNSFYKKIIDKIFNFEFLNFEEALKLYKEGDLFFFGESAKFI